MAKQKEIKTNAMRILDRMKIPYTHYTYECGEFIDGIQVADMLDLPHEKVYKTLVTQSPSKEYFVFVIPIEGGQGCGPEIRGNAPRKGYQYRYRIHPRRLHRSGDEETI